MTDFSISLLQNTDRKLPRNQLEIDHNTADVSRKGIPVHYASNIQVNMCVVVSGLTQDSGECDAHVLSALQAEFRRC